MAVKYFIKYYDTEGIQHYADIDVPTYVGQSTQVGGEIELTYADIDANLDAIRGQGLRVSLEANTALTFGDLWVDSNQEQKTIKVTYKRDNVTLFAGWLNPEGFFENWVDTSWNVSFDCVDGLGYLENLAFVDDATGSPIRGRKTQLDILSIALKRTGLDQYINTSVQIRYTGLADTLDPLANVVVNTERYVKDDGETIMSCIEVLNDILEPYTACITSYEGQWYIFKPNQMFNNQIQNYYIYDSLGSFVGNKTLSSSAQIGSQINGFYPHHCSGNQRISNKPTLTAYRINYKYGLSTDLLDNPNFYSEDGISLDGWHILDTSSAIPLGAGQNGVTLIGASGISLPPLVSDAFDVVVGVGLQVSMKYFTSYTGISGELPKFRFVIQLQSEPDNYYLHLDGSWTTDAGQSVQEKDFLFYQENSILINASDTPVDGFINVFFYTPTEGSASSSALLTLCSLVNLNDAPTALVGEFHTVQRTSKPSSTIKDIKEVYTGDSISDIYEGTLYKADGETPTETWYRKGFAELKPILQIMGEETLRAKQLPARVFSGDVYGYFNYLSVVTINGIDGKFMPIKYNYNTKNNIISCEFRQLFGGELMDIEYTEPGYDYGNVVTPTII